MSGSSGVVMMVVPSVLGVVTWSPPLDSVGQFLWWRRGDSGDVVGNDVSAGNVCILLMFPRQLSQFLWWWW